MPGARLELLRLMQEDDALLGTIMIMIILLHPEGRRRDHDAGDVFFRVVDAERNRFGAVQAELERDDEVTQLLDEAAGVRSHLPLAIFHSAPLASLSSVSVRTSLSGWASRVTGASAAISGAESRARSRRRRVMGVTIEPRRAAEVAGKLSGPAISRERA